MFDSYCKTVIRNASINLKRGFALRREREATGVDEAWFDSMEAMDDYPSAHFELKVGTLRCFISSGILYKAMITLTERQKTVLILDFWNELPDKEIAKNIGVTLRTVYNTRQSAFKAIQMYYEKAGILADRTIL